MSRPRPRFDPFSPRPFPISRSGLELYAECPRCFFFEKRLGCSRPSGLPFTLNNAVDALLKREFDSYRAKGEPHPLMTGAGIDAVPFSHPNIEKWRDTDQGIRFLHEPTRFDVFGAVDDVWLNAAGELIVADYKATARAAEVTELNEPWHATYKRQLEIYQWLFRRNGFTVSPTAYWVYANGDTTEERFDETLRFRMTVIPYSGSDEWVEPHILAAHVCLMGSSPPAPAPDCEHCRFADKRAKVVVPPPAGT